MSFTDTSGRSDSYNQGAAHDSGFYDPDQHDNQIVAVYADEAAATRAQEALVGAGVPAGAVQVVSHISGDAAPGQSRVEDRSSQSVGDSVLGAFISLFTPEEEHASYSEAVERGHAMVVVTPTGSIDRHQVVELLEQSQPIDFDAKLAEWRQAAYDESGGARTPPETRPEAQPAPSGETRRVGRRESLERPGRVRSYVADRPGTMGTGGQTSNATAGATSSGINAPP